MDSLSNKKRRKLSFTFRTGVLCFGCLLFLSSGPVNAAKFYVADADFDGIEDSVDNCLGLGNPEQKDHDGDGIGNLCEPGDGNTDTDGDGIHDRVDNCVNVPNPLQTDMDKDNIGIMCEPGDGNTDTDGDLILDEADNCPNDSNPLQKDLDKDNVGTVCDPDESVFRSYKIAKFFEKKQTTVLARKVFFEEESYETYLRAIELETTFWESLVRQRNNTNSETYWGNWPVKACDCHKFEKESQYPEVGSRRPIIGPGADFPGIDEGQGHIQGPIDAMDCLQCHYTGAHKGGVVKLVNADAPWVIYDYDPDDKRSIEPFCWSCHDDDGKTSSWGDLGRIPFSDGKLVPSKYPEHMKNECTSCHGNFYDPVKRVWYWNAHRARFTPSWDTLDCDKIKTPWRKFDKPY